MRADKRTAAFGDGDNKLVKEGKTIVWRTETRWRVLENVIKVLYLLVTSGRGFEIFVPWVDLVGDFCLFVGQTVIYSFFLISLGSLISLTLRTSRIESYALSTWTKGKR